MDTLLTRSPALLQDGATDISVFPSLLAMRSLLCFEILVLFLLSFLGFIFLLKLGLFIGSVEFGEGPCTQ